MFAVINAYFLRKFKAELRKAEGNMGSLKGIFFSLFCGVLFFDVCYFDLCAVSVSRLIETFDLYLE